MPQPHRLTAAHLERLATHLTDRERQALWTLATVYAATTGQIARVIFPGQPSADRLTRRTLQRLTAAGLVRRFPDRTRDRKVGASGYVHALTTAGLRLAGGHHSVGLRQRRTWRPSWMFLAHRLALSELYVRLVELQHTAAGPVVREFQAEPDCYRRYHGPFGQPAVIRPDGLVRLQVGRIEVSWFLEIDLDTEKRDVTISAKCEAYVRYEASGREQRRHGVFPGVLFVVPTSARLRQIQRVIARQPPSARPLFAVATEDEALTALTTGEVAS